MVENLELEQETVLTRPSDTITRDTSETTSSFLWPAEKRLLATV